MKNSIFKIFFWFVLFTIIGCSSANVGSSKNEDFVKAYVEARNNYDIDKVNSLVEESYRETFVDGSIEIENKESLAERILGGKEIDSHIKLIDIKTVGENVVTIEENSNYIDVALKRKPRTFKIVYTFNNDKILHQKIDTLLGYHQVMSFNADRYDEFREYCEQNNLNCNIPSQNQESLSNFRKILEKYKNE
jgi:hypothetical protein